MTADADEGQLLKHNRTSVSHGVYNRTDKPSDKKAASKDYSAIDSKGKHKASTIADKSQASANELSSTS
jgi:hypothetical protein